MIAYEGPLWRIQPADQRDPLAPARAPEGRFHHSGQRVLYASLSPEGAASAMQRYVGADDPPRIIQPLAAKLSRLIDLRTLPDPTAVSIVWQDIRAQGEPSPTWVFSDAARADRADGILYPSRTRPELTHVALFNWGPDQLEISGPATPWP